MNVLHATALFTLKLLILCFVHFTSVEKKNVIALFTHSLGSFIYDFKEHLFTIDYVSGNVVGPGDVMLNQRGEPQGACVR